MTQGKPIELTGAMSEDQIRAIKQTVDELYEKKLTIRYDNDVPTTSDLSDNEISIYDDGAGTKAAYAITQEGNLLELGGGIPQGGIIMWSGTIATIPTGWALCDGSSSTPDLRNRFIVCADADSGGTAMSTVTGSALQTSNGIIQQHNHPIAAWEGYAAGTGYFGGRASTSSPSWTGYTSNNSGGNAYNIAVFFALAYIMKT